MRILVLKWLWIPILLATVAHQPPATAQEEPFNPFNLRVDPAEPLAGQLVTVRLETSGCSRFLLWDHPSTNFETEGGVVRITTDWYIALFCPPYTDYLSKPIGTFETGSYALELIGRAPSSGETVLLTRIEFEVGAAPARPPITVPALGWRQTAVLAFGMMLIGGIGLRRIG